MGWLGAAVPEEYGGAGLGHIGLCVLAEELGRSLAPVPFSSSVYLATEALLIAGSEAQKEELLPQLVAGDLIGTLAWAEGNGNPNPARIKARVSGGRLSGVKWPVPDGGVADFVLVLARDDSDRVVLALARMGAAGFTQRRWRRWTRRGSRRSSPSRTCRLRCCRAMAGRR